MPGVQILGKAAQNYYEMKSRPVMCSHAKGLPMPWAPQETKTQRGKGYSGQEAVLERAYSLLSQDMWVLNSRGRRRQCAPTLKDVPPGPLVWRQKALRESHSPQEPQAGEDGY